MVFVVFLDSGLPAPGSALLSYFAVIQALQVGATPRRTENRRLCAISVSLSEDCPFGVAKKGTAIRASGFHAALTEVIAAFLYLSARGLHTFGALAGHRTGDVEGTPMSIQQERIPVTVLTGFLGAGKTTLLNHLLSQHQAQNSAVIVNEFGEIGIDAQLVVGVDEEVLEINNGCICCTVRADLVTTIERLLTRLQPIRRILIETTGLADPAPIIQSFILDERLRTATELDALVTVVDARHNGTWLAMGAEDVQQGRKNTAREQIAFADLLLLNKTDLVDQAGLHACEADLRRINPLAHITRIRDGVVPADAVLDLRAFDLWNALRLEPELLSDLSHEHADDIGSVVVRPAAELDPDCFFRWLSRFVQARGSDVLRLKGIVALAGERRRYVFHGVHMTLDGRPGRPWQADEARQGEIAFIGRRLDPESPRMEVESCISNRPPG